MASTNPDAPTQPDVEPAAPEGKRKKRERKPKEPRPRRERDPEAATNVAKAVPVIALVVAFLILAGIGITTHQMIFLMGAICALGAAVLLGIATQEHHWPVIGIGGMVLIAIVGIGIGMMMAQW